MYGSAPTPKRTARNIHFFGAGEGIERDVEMRDRSGCEDTPRQGRLEYWDVTCNFRSLEHRMQMTNPPGRTVTVNQAR